MRNVLKTLIFIAAFLLSSCVREEKIPNTPMGNFEALWKIIDERYCFLEYKEIDWDGIYIKYETRIYPDMPDDELFYVLGRMLEELKDGHVNLYSEYDITHYTEFFDDYPRNFNETVMMKYLGNRYGTEGSLRYTILPDNIGYIYCENFSETMRNEKITEILKSFAGCKGLIADVRSNSGGSIGNSVLLASHFTSTKVLTGYIQHKTGKAHNSFSSPKAIYIEPGNGYCWSKPVAVLANRQTFSAGNYFVNNMKCFPQVFTVGDITGGGSGLPFTSELPNGWGVRFSASPHFNAHMEHIEFGIEPDYKVDMNAQEEDKGIDSIIEKARSLINNSTLFSE